MAGKRTRKAAAEETMVDVPAMPPLKSSMEESADALAGVEGALTGTKRKAQAAPAAAVGGSSPKKKSAKAAATRLQLFPHGHHGSFNFIKESGLRIDWKN